MRKTEKKVIYTLAEMDARKKIREWYSDKKNLIIYSCIPVQHDDKGYEVSFSYDEDDE